MATTVSFKFLDATGSDTTEVIHFPSTVTPAQIVGWVDTAIEHLDDAIGAQITQVKINVDYDLTGTTVKASPTAGSRISAGGLLTFTTTEGVPYSVFVPALLDAHMVAGNLVVAGALEDYSDALVDGIDVGGTVIVASDRGDNELEVFLRGKLADRDKL